MKYNTNNKPYICIQTNSKCYKNETRKLNPVKGILWHSTGANNPKISRYVQPLTSDSNYSAMIKLLGTNKVGNDYNHSSYNSGLNAFIGKLADGTVSTVQTMPWTNMPWGCGSGPKGSCNTGWIQFEICEDDLTSKDYFEKVYKEACELTAYLCKLYNLNPKGTVIHCGVKVPVILCHKDSHNLGLGSGHADVLHWFSKFGKTMDNVRNDVYNIMNSKNSNSEITVQNTQIIKEEEEMTQEQFNSMFKTLRKTFQDNDSNSWSEDARKWAINNNLISGSGEINGQPNYMWADLLTREQLITILYRFAQMMNK